MNSKNVEKKVKSTTKTLAQYRRTPLRSFTWIIILCWNYHGAGNTTTILRASQPREEICLDRLVHPQILRCIRHGLKVYVVLLVMIVVSLLVVLVDVVLVCFETKK